MDHINLLTEEVARRLRLSPRTLEQWRYRGIGPAFRRVGGRVIYAVEEIERFEKAAEGDSLR
jgi:DNA-binding transcriptional MerR regulator